MAYEGVLANAAVTTLAGACYASVAVAVHRRKMAERRSIATVALFGTIGVYLVLAGFRQAVAYVGILRPDFAWLDPVVYHVVVVPAAFAVVPLTYLTAYVVWGRPERARVVALAFSGVGALGIVLVWLGGISGPSVTYWGSEWTINSAAAKVMLVLFLTLPALAASTSLLYNGSTLGGAAGRRLRLVGWSCLVYYLAFTADAFGLDGVAFILARLVTAGAAFLGYVAYFRVPDAPASPLRTARA